MRNVQDKMKSSENMCIILDYRRCTGNLFSVRFISEPIRLGGGTSAAESMSEGVPVLTTDLGDVALEVEDAYKVKDYEEMKQRIFELEAVHKQWEKWSSGSQRKSRGTDRF